MTKKTWIKVKCGILEPKHIVALGQAWYLYLYMLDIANWETGTIPEWKDEYAAQDLGKQTSMIREHRKHLANEGYISFQKKQYCQLITIHNWTNPRRYDGVVQNQSYDKDELPDGDEIDQSTPQSAGQTINSPSVNSLPSSNHITHNTLKELPQNDSEPFSVEPERIPVVYANNEYVEVEDIKETKPKHGKNYKSLISAVASVCKMDIGIKTQAGQVGKAARELDNAGYTPDQVYDFLDWWKKFDWRWQKEHRYPSPHELLTTISKTVEEKKPEPTDEYLRSIGYK